MENRVPDLRVQVRWRSLRPSEPAQEIDNLTLGPETVVRTVPPSDKGAVTAALDLDERDVGIGGDLPPRLGEDAYEWIIGCVHDQRWHSNLFDHVRCRRPRIV